MTIFNLPTDLVEEIFSRVPMKSTRSVCKTLNTLSQSPSFTKLHIGKDTATTKEGETRIIVLMDYNLHLISVVFNGIGTDPSSEHKGKLSCLNDSEQVKISRIFHCEGILLCILKKDSRFVVWNPFLGQTRWIEPRYSHLPYGWDRFSYALGYENKESCRSYKLLRFIDYYYRSPGHQFFWYEIYDFDSDLWTTLDVTPHWCKMFCNPGVSLKGNTYFCASMRNVEEEDGVDDHIICFDFTSESFGPLLHLPFSAGVDDYVTLSCLREEKLAVSLAHNEVNPYEFDIWISTKIEAEMVSWSKFLRVETTFDNCVPFISGSYFIDEEKKVAIGFDDMNYHRLNIIGDVGYFRQVDVGEREPADRNCRPDLCVYVPSLVQIKQPAGGERTQQSDIEKCRFDQYMSRLAAFEGKSSGRMMRVENESAWGYEKEKTPDS